jgi:hypothetical protein
MKKVNWQVLAVFSLCYSIIIILFLNNVVDKGFVSSSLYAGLLNLLNSFAALYLFTYSFKKNNQVFLIFVVGGMGARLLLMLISVFLIIKFLNIDLYGFILVFFVFYFALLLIEVVYFNRLVKSKKQIK